MTPQDHHFFHQHGYISLGKILTDDEVKHYVEVYDRDRSETADFWYKFGHHQSVNCDALVSSPEFDGIIRHPKAMEAIHELMGGDVCFSEICVRHMGPYDGELNRGWHRDRPHWNEHPYRMDYIQLMLYLTNVDETTHCFSISPEPTDGEILDRDEHLERGGIHDLHGEAGTGILFNVSVLHTATTRPTQQERKTVQTYYGHRDHKYLSEDSLIPTALWRDHPDPEVRGFYSVLNGKTRRYLERTADTENLSLHEIGQMLYEIDRENGKRRQ
jgi:hypothetical protein